MVTPKFFTQDLPFLPNYYITLINNPNNCGYASQLPSSYSSEIVYCCVIQTTSCCCNETRYSFKFYYLPYDITFHDNRLPTVFRSDHSFVTCLKCHSTSRHTCVIFLDFSVLSHYFKKDNLIADPFIEPIPLFLIQYTNPDFDSFITPFKVSLGR